MCGDLDSQSLLQAIHMHGFVKHVCVTWLWMCVVDANWPGADINVCGNRNVTPESPNLLHHRLWPMRHRGVDRMPRSEEGPAALSTQGSKSLLHFDYKCWPLSFSEWPNKAEQSSMLLHRHHGGLTGSNQMPRWWSNPSLVTSEARMLLLILLFTSCGNALG